MSIIIQSLRKIYRTLKRIYLKVFISYKEFSIERKIDKKWFGNDYGGFYLHPNLLNSNSVVYSVGIGEDISFDRAVFEELDCNVHMFDPTPKSIEWVENQNLPKKMVFHPFGLDAESGTVEFYLPVNPDHVSGSLMRLNHNVDDKRAIPVEMKSLKDTALGLGTRKIDVLKIDIEGAEYVVLQSVLESKLDIDQVLIEFHSRFFNDGRQKTVDAIHLLKQHGYQIFAVSDSYEEVSFIHNRLFQ
ncbi:hypothetical protein D3C87_284030 [compost metagenome]